MSRTKDSLLQISGGELNDGAPLRGVRTQIPHVETVAGRRHDIMDSDTPQRWEYRTLEPPKGLTMRESVDPTEELDALGAEGWELTSTINYDGGGTKFLLFKRPVTDE